MYFAVLGKHPQLSLAEFAVITPTIVKQRWQIVFFESTLTSDELRSHLERLGGVTKRGECISPVDDEDPQIAEFLTWVQLVGAPTIELGMRFKKTYGVKRFKLVDQQSSDLEVKQEGKEIIQLGSDLWLVNWRQNIQRFEVIDMEKPVRGMQIGMMPAKLTQIMLNIWVARAKKWKLSGADEKLTDTTTDSSLTIYDPFAGFGTTGLVANSLGHHFIGSDINITPAKQNQKWRFETSYADSTKHFTLFKQDVLQPFTHPILKQVDVIVTEWRLGPVIKKSTRLPELHDHAEKIIALYEQFFSHIREACPGVPIVVTIPNYPRLQDTIPTHIKKAAEQAGFDVTYIDTYSRKGQEVSREVWVLSHP